MITIFCSAVLLSGFGTSLSREPRILYILNRSVAICKSFTSHAVLVVRKRTTSYYSSQKPITYAQPSSSLYSLQTLTSVCFPQWNRPGLNRAYSLSFHIGNISDVCKYKLVCDTSVRCLSQSCVNEIYKVYMSEWTSVSTDLHNPSYSR